jgi:hypothetical protein
MERNKLNLPGKEAEGLSGKRKADVDNESEGTIKTATPALPRKKRAKEPNPLSMRKPKKAMEAKGGNRNPAKKRKQDV